MYEKQIILDMLPDSKFLLLRNALSFAGLCFFLSMHWLFYLSNIVDNGERAFLGDSAQLSGL